MKSSLAFIDYNDIYCFLDCNVTYFPSYSNTDCVKELNYENIFQIGIKNFW